VDFIPKKSAELIWFPIQKAKSRPEK
jgi:hypothetical protein